MVICPHCQTVNHPSSVACTGCASPLGLDPSVGGDPFIGRSLGGGRFTLRAIVGSGEIGMVYRGSDGRTGQTVAVKIVHPDVAATHGDELLRSAGMVARLRHAKIATVLAAAREGDGTTFIVTEYIEGETLKDMLGRTGPLGPRRAADILFQLCSALAPFHRAGRPHANLKPENVFLAQRDDGSDFVKIVDAGSPDLFGVRETLGGHVIVGNPKYFSPEQVLGEEVGLPSDLFTLGIIGYQLLSGALPFFGATPDQLLDAIVNNDPTPVEQRTSGTLPAKLAESIRKCLTKKDNERFPSLRSLATVLASVIKNTQIATPAPTARRFGFGGGGAQPSTVVADLNALDGLMEDDEDATVARAIDDDALAALGLGPEPSTRVMDDIPEPLMFTGALESSAISAALAEARPASPAVAADDPLQAALAEAAAQADGHAIDDEDDAPPRSRPPAPDMVRLGEVSDDFDPFSGMQMGSAAAATPAASQPTTPAPSEHLTNAILDAMDGVDVPAVNNPAMASPLATAADFKAFAPTSTMASSTSLEALPPPAPTRSYRTVAMLMGLLLVVGAGAYVFMYVLGDDPVETPRRRPVAKAPTPPKAPTSAAAASAAPPSAAQAGSLASGAPATAGSAAPASVAAAPATDGPLKVTFESTPGKASVYVGGAKLGTAPVEVEFAPGDEARTYTFKLNGYRTLKKSVDPKALREAGEDRIAVRLEKRKPTVARNGKPKVKNGKSRKPPKVVNPYDIENPY